VKGDNELQILRRCWNPIVCLQIWCMFLKSDYMLDSDWMLENVIIRWNWISTLETWIISCKILFFCETIGIELYVGI